MNNACGAGGAGGENALPENYEGVYGGCQKSGCTRFLTDLLAARFKCACGEMQWLHDFLPRSDEDKARVLEAWRGRGVCDEEDNNDDNNDIDNDNNNAVGRPPISIVKSDVDYYRNLFFSWVNVAYFLNISIRKLFDWRRDNNFLDEKPFIGEDQVETLLLERHRLIPNVQTGELGLMSYINNLGYRVELKLLRRVIHKIDGAGVEQRKLAKTIKRRNYDGLGGRGFGGMNHIDTWHKAIRYGIVVSMGVDGFSRLITHLKVADNNRSHTWYLAFMEGVREYGAPDRTRTDYGGENRGIAMWMLENRGLNRGSHICGKSTSNTRVERTHRDIREQVLDPYLDLFVALEDQGLSIDSLRDIFVLQYMFLARIQCDLGKK